MAQRRFVFPDEAGVPRLQRRFPLRALNDLEAAETRAELNQILVGVEDMLWKLAREIFPKRTSHDVLDEVVQIARVRLFEYSLPHFDVARRVKLTTFIFTCVQNHVRQLRESWLCRRQLRSLDVGTVDAEAPDSINDRLIERAANAIIDDPISFDLTTAEARALLARVNATGDVQNTEVAKELGYDYACTLSTRLAAVRAKLKHIDIHAIPAEQKNVAGPMANSRKAIRKTL